jgi:hypothetical protein
MPESFPEDGFLGRRWLTIQPTRAEYYAMPTFLSTPGCARPRTRPEDDFPVYQALLLPRLGIAFAISTSYVFRPGSAVRTHHLPLYLGGGVLS